MDVCLAQSMMGWHRLMVHRSLVRMYHRRCQLFSGFAGESSCVL